MDILYIIIPAYNEEENIKRTIDEWYPKVCLDTVNADSRLVIVNDGSKDNTASIVNKEIENRERLILLNKENGGHGSALLLGYRYALENRADYVFQTDSDGQTVASEFDDFWNKRNDYQAIFGKRTIRGDGQARAFIEKVLCFILRIIFGVKVPDANAPFRLYTKKYLGKYIKILPQDYFLPNVILTVMGMLCKETIIFENITFNNRGGGIGSIHIRKIVRIGYESVIGFIKLKRKINETVEKSVVKQKSKIKQISLKVFILFMLVMMAFIVVMQSSNTIWHMGDSYTDSSVFKYVACEMTHGRMPYRDTFDHKGPLVYWINILGMALDYWRGIYVVEWVVLIITFFFMYKCARIYCKPLLAILSVFITVGCLFKYYEWGNLVEEYALPFIAIATYIFLDFFQNNKRTYFRIGICGLCFGAICLLRPNMAALWPVMCIGALIKLILNKQIKKELLPCMASFLAGITIILLPTLLWLVGNNAYSDFIHAYWEYNGLYSIVLSEAHSRKDAFLFYLKDPMMLISLSIIAFLCAWKKREIDYCYLIYLFLSVGLISMSGKISMHYGMILVPLMIYPVAGLLGEIQNSRNREKSVRKILELACSCIVFVSLVRTAWLNALQNTASQYQDIGKDFISREVRQISDIIQENSSESDEITVCGNWDEVYLLSGRLSASKYSYQTVCSIDIDMENEYFSDLEQNKPKLIVLRNDFYVYDRMMDFIDRNGYISIGKDEDNVAVVFKLQN